MHIANLETASGENPLAELDAFKAFQNAIRERCEEPPVVTELHEVGAYRFPGM